MMPGEELGWGLRLKRDFAKNECGDPSRDVGPSSGTTQPSSPRF